MFHRPWREIPPGSDDKQAKHGIANYERPWRSIIEQEALQPVFNEIDVIWFRTSFLSQPNLKSCKWTGYAEPHLGNDNGDCTKVHDSEPWCIDPVPTAQVAKDD